MGDLPGSPSVAPSAPFLHASGAREKRGAGPLGCGGTLPLAGGRRWIQARERPFESSMVERSAQRARFSDAKRVPSARPTQGGRGTYAFVFRSRVRSPVQPRFRRARTLFLFPESDFKPGRASSRHGGRITVRARPTQPPRWPQNLRLFFSFPFLFLVPPPIQPRFRRPWTPFLARIGA